MSASALDRATEAPLAIFRREFSTITKMVEDSEFYHVEITLPYDAIGVGMTATVIIKHRNGRGFGMTWHLDRGQLHGLRSRCFDASKPDDAPANAEWIRELERRLGTDGAARGEVAHALGFGYDGSHHTQRTKMSRELVKRAY